jgi:hypothetical protein
MNETAFNVRAYAVKPVICMSLQITLFLSNVTPVMCNSAVGFNFPTCICLFGDRRRK